MSNNNQIVYSMYRPSKKPLANIVIVHGMMEHRKRYDYFARALCDAGFAVITYDQRGHGDSVSNPDELGFFANERGWKLLIQDCNDVCDQIKKEYPKIPTILFGHSMGSIVVRSFTKRHDINIEGLILSGAPNYQPAVKFGHLAAQAISLVQGPTKRSELLHNMSVGAFNKTIMNPRTPSDWISVNEENVDTYLNDPLCQFKFTNSAYADLMFGLRDINDLMRWGCNNPNLPILFIAGSEDVCTGLEKGLDHSIGRLKEVGYNYVERRVYPGLRHEILNEKERDQVITDVIQWIKRNCL